MHKVSNIVVSDLQEVLTCYLCKGYIIDATTVVECLHSFCKSCIVTFLENRNTCPVCDTLLHKTRPHYAIRSDYVLQAIVYKLLPKVFDSEMAARRQFYAAFPPSVCRSISPEKRGDITLSAYREKEEERVSLELTYWCPPKCSTFSFPLHGNIQPTTYLLCPPALTVGHLEKLVRLKFELKPSTHHRVHFFFNSGRRGAGDDHFSAEYTLSDLVCLNSLCPLTPNSPDQSSWHDRRRDYYYRSLRPMKLFFSVTETPCPAPQENGGHEEVGGETVKAINGQAVLLTNGG